MGQATVMARSGEPPPDDLSDETCRVFGSLSDSAAPDSLVRFVVGEDQEPQQLSKDDIERELGDPFATVLLAKGSFPATAEGVFEALDEAVGADHPLGAKSQMSFILGEGSQIAFADAPALERGLRFVVTRGQSPDGPDLVVSAFRPDQNDDVELMAWDEAAGGFNFYRSLAEKGAWVFAGNSLHALVDPTQGKGPFMSHTSGNFLMKELRAPWINWHSPDANIFATVFRDDDSRREHPWFTEKEPQGALVCETTVARPAIKRWTAARFKAAVGQDGTVDQPRRIVQQIVETPTVNLISSHTSSQHAVSADSVDLPQTFFIDSEALTELLGLSAPPDFAVSGSVYAQSLQTFKVRLDDGQPHGFRQPGDTHFAFVVPERANEDLEVLRAAVEAGLVTDRLAACLLMTDFPNPVFSDRRAALLAHVPDKATVKEGKSDFSQQTADAILAAADGTPAGSAEKEFAERWGAGEGWKDAFDALLAGYYDAVTARLETQEGFDDYFRLAESRRNRVRDMPIFEFPLLFAHTNVPKANRVMRTDGSVAEG